MDRKPVHTYARGHGLWAVYRMSYSQNGSIGTKVSGHATRAEAYAEVCRLNGWNTNKIKSDIKQK